MVNENGCEWYVLCSSWAGFAFKEILENNKLCKKINVS